MRLALAYPREPGGRGAAAVGGVGARRDAHRYNRLMRKTPAGVTAALDSFAAAFVLLLDHGALPTAKSAATVANALKSVSRDVRQVLAHTGRAATRLPNEHLHALNAALTIQRNHLLGETGHERRVTAR